MGHREDTFEGIPGDSEVDEEEAVERSLVEIEDVDQEEDVYYLASRGSRFLAQVLDAVALAAAFGLGVTNSMAMGVVLVVLFSIFQVFLLSTQGQTLGKSLMNIKIVTAEDETNPGFLRAFIVRYIVTGLLGFIPFFSLANYLFIFRDDYRCIHDHLAGTKVVED